MKTFFKVKIIFNFNKFINSNLILNLIGGAKHGSNFNNAWNNCVYTTVQKLEVTPGTKIKLNQKLDVLYFK